MPELAIPPPQRNDSEDVHWALSTAASLWASGARQDALRWLRRAAEAANDRDDEVRALELFRAAAEIRESIPPPAPGAAVSTASSTPTPASSTKPIASASPKTLPASKPPPLPPSVRPSALPARAVTKSEASPLPPPGSVRAPVNGSASPRGSTLASVRPLPKPTPPPPPPRGRARPEPIPPPEARTGSGPRPAISKGAAPAVLPALRLAMLPAGEHGELRVTLLGQDQVAPPGSVTGVFVPTSDADAAALLARVSKSSG